MKFKNIFKHFHKICTHKRWVFHYCRKAGIGWRGFWHDMSKFSPTEFWESVKYYQGTASPIDAAKKDKGWSKAWMHHKGRNRHHYEYWQDNFDKGGAPLQMPFKDAVELVCDYLSAGRAYMGKNFSYAAEYEWWLNKISQPIAMHPQTMAFVDKVLLNLKRSELFPNKRYSIFNKRDLRNIYNLEEQKWLNITRSQTDLRAVTQVLEDGV